MSLSRATKKASICNFLPEKLDSGLTVLLSGWMEKGLTAVNQLFEGTTLKVFSHLQAQIGIASNYFF